MNIYYPIQIINGRKLEYFKAYEKGYYTRTGREYVSVDSDYQSIYTGVIDTFVAWLKYDDFSEWSNSRFFKANRTKSVKNLESNLQAIRDGKDYLSNLLDELIAERGEAVVAQTIINNASAIQIEQDLITYKGPSDSNVTNASINTIAEILSGTKDVNRAKEIDNWYDDFEVDFDEEEY